jgi:hypothetical protein
MCAERPAEDHDRVTIVETSLCVRCRNRIKPAVDVRRRPGQRRPRPRAGSSPGREGRLGQLLHPVSPRPGSGRHRSRPGWLAGGRPGKSRGPGGGAGHGWSEVLRVLAPGPGRLGGPGQARRRTGRGGGAGAGDADGRHGVNLRRQSRRGERAKVEDQVILGGSPQLAVTGNPTCGGRSCPGRRVITKRNPAPSRGARPLAFADRHGSNRGEIFTATTIDRGRLP